METDKKFGEIEDLIILWGSSIVGFLTYQFGHPYLSAAMGIVTLISGMSVALKILL